MLLRNLNQIEDLCSGTRMIITHLDIWSVNEKIISGKNISTSVTILKILSTGDLKWPFKINRRQLSLAPYHAVTINKSQGHSLNQVGLYIPNRYPPMANYR